jgi:hypothetical protein
MKKLFFLIIFIGSCACASEIELHEEVIKEADCLIVNDENSIICKYTSPILLEDKEVMIEWINPDGESTRKRAKIKPAGHSSVYDFRYLSGRIKGIWMFRVFDDKDIITTTFEIR